MNIAYVNKTFQPRTLDLIDQANEIIEEYAGQGYDLTLRQLYYQMVARDIIRNKQTEYKRLGSIVSDARRAGLIPWDAIVDRTRNLRGLAHWDTVADIVSACATQFRIDRWENQINRIEVWVEKEALVGVVARASTALDVPYFACRGYPSDSEVWAASRRFIDYADKEQDVHIIHLGDHDPSGIDMTRDLIDRFELFEAWGVEVHRIALNMDQVRRYNPPPNPAKTTDSRFDGYEREFGTSSWELDALEPSVINDLITEMVLSLRDDNVWQADDSREREGRRQLRDIAADLRAVDDNEDDDDIDMDYDNE